MPTYEYQCPNGHTLTDFESMNAPTTRVCPECPSPVPCDCQTVQGADECCDYHEVYMTRQISGGGGVLWKQGAPTPRFGRRR
jgi:hypothetical protein